MAPPIFFVASCYTLMKYEKNAPLLAFSVLLFSSGAVVTLNELYGAFDFSAFPEIVPRRPDDDEFNLPWGDFLLGFSAFCVIVEEFSLLSIYDLAIENLTRLTDDARTKHQELVGLHEHAKTLKERAQKKHDELVRLCEKANTLYRDMSRQSEERQESLRAVWLKVLGVVIVIVLAFTSMCG